MDNLKDYCFQVAAFLCLVSSINTKRFLKTTKIKSNFKKKPHLQVIFNEYLAFYFYLTLYFYKKKMKSDDVKSVQFFEEMLNALELVANRYKEFGFKMVRKIGKFVPYILTVSHNPAFRDMVIAYTKNDNSYSGLDNKHFLVVCGVLRVPNPEDPVNMSYVTSFCRILNNVYNINDENEFMNKFIDFLKTSELWILYSLQIENFLDSLNVAINISQEG